MHVCSFAVSVLPWDWRRVRREHPSLDPEGSRRHPRDTCQCPIYLVILQSDSHTLKWFCWLFNALKMGRITISKILHDHRRWQQRLTNRYTRFLFSSLCNSIPASWPRIPWISVHFLSWRPRIQSSTVPGTRMQWTWTGFHWPIQFTRPTACSST